MGHIKQPTLVKPHGATMCADGNEYGFAVFPGDPSKLAIHFGGGGACWEADGALGKVPVTETCWTVLAGAFGQSVTGQGVQDVQTGPAAGYTTIVLPDCTGDAFIGDATLTASDGTVLQQRGYRNALAVKAWAMDNFRQHLDAFSIIGYSAGALAAMGWSGDLLGDFKYGRATVLLDSYSTKVPPGVEGPILAGWGGCGAHIFDEEWREMCKEGKVSVSMVLERDLKRFPNVAFATVQGKEDETHIRFYKGIAQSWGLAEHTELTGPELYAGTNEEIASRQSVHPNFKIYYVDGPGHVFTNNPRLNTATSAGVTAPAPACQPTLLAWVTAFFAGEVVEDVCYGPAGRTPVAGTTDYCTVGDMIKCDVESMAPTAAAGIDPLGLAARSGASATSSPPLLPAGLSAACVALAVAAGAVAFRRLATPANLEPALVEAGLAE